MTEKKEHQGTKNLKPYHMKTEEEQKEFTRKGGVASGEARRKKRKLKNDYIRGLEILEEIKSKNYKLNGESEKANILNEIGLIVFTHLDILNDEKTTIEAKLKILDTIADRIEGKPVNKNLLDATIENKDLSQKDLDIIRKNIEKAAKKEAENLKNKVEDIN